MKSEVQRMLYWLGTTAILLASSTSVAGPIEGTPFERRLIQDDAGRSITYYISRPKAKRAPILMMIQGSGCGAVFASRSGKNASTVFNLQPFAAEGQFTVVAVEKPFSLDGALGDGRGQSCPVAFNENFTAASWLKALRASLDDARTSAWVDPARTLVFGHSEGAVMASMLAASDPRTTDVVAIGGSGTTQLYDFIAQAYLSCFDASACLADVDKNVRDIAANPGSATQFAWGHPYKRWSSFFAVDPGDNFLKSKARVYLAFGTDDRSTPALSQEVAVARLTVAGRDVTVRRVPDANHSLVKGAGYKTTDDEYRAALAWFWRGGASK